MKILLLFLIKVYQLTISPMLGNVCRFHPTCSHYAAGAIRKHGALKGSWLAGKRVCRCNPWFGSGGLDEVP